MDHPIYNVQAPRTMGQLSTMTEEKPAIIDVKLYSYIRHAGLVTKYKRTNVEKKKKQGKPLASVMCQSFPVIMKCVKTIKGRRSALAPKKNSAIMHIKLHNSIRLTI